MDPVGLEVLGRLLPSLALVVGALLLVRRWARRSGGAAGGPGVRVVARTGVTRGAMVAVVAVGRRRFLVGAGDQRVSLLAELDPDDVETEHAAALDGAAAGSSRSFDPARATDRRVLLANRPWMGLLDRLRAMTVRTHLERPIRDAHD